MITGHPDVPHDRVIDASAVIAFLKPEATTMDLSAVFSGNAILSVNYSEVADYFARLGRDRAFIETMLGNLDMNIVPLDADVALDAAMLRPEYPKESIADRCCLAYAKRTGVAALTGDRRWAAIAEAVGVEVVLIR
jgi:ribonuclease VapC